MAKKRARPQPPPTQTTPTPTSPQPPTPPQPPSPQPPSPQPPTPPLTPTQPPTQPPTPPLTPTQPPTPPQPSTPTLPSKRVRYDDMDPTLCRYFMSVIGSCIRFSSMHYNAEEHIRAYATDLNELEPSSKRSAICSWLAEMQEVD